MAAAMLFSVLLPTHDRLEYLRYAVESVRRQDEDDWELIVSDNDSTDDIAGFVEGLGDERVRYVRTESFVPVTENWNNALRHSRGTTWSCWVTTTRCSRATCRVSGR